MHANKQLTRGKTVWRPEGGAGLGRFRLRAWSQGPAIRRQTAEEARALANPELSPIVLRLAALASAVLALGLCLTQIVQMPSAPPAPSTDKIWVESWLLP